MTISKSLPKISCVQLTVLLCASRLFSESVNFPLSNSDYGMQRFAVIFAVNVILFIQYIPLIYLAKKYPGESAVSIITNRSKPLGWIYGIFITASVFVSALSAVSRNRFYASSTIFSEAPPILLVVMLLLVCAFGMWKGIQAVARSGVIFAGVFAVFLIFTVISVRKLFEIEWLYGALIEDGEKFLTEVSNQLGSNSEIIFFAVLAEYTDNKPYRAILWYIPVITVLLELMFLLEMLVLGPFLSSAGFPFFTVSSLSNIVLFQRLDGIDVLVWTLMCIVKITLAFLCVRTIFERLSGKRAGLIVSFFLLIILAWISVILGGTVEFARGTADLLKWGIPMTICGALFPATAIFLAKNKRKDRLKDEKKTLP